MEIGDKVQVNDIASIYNFRIGEITDYSMNSGKYELLMDVDNKHIWIDPNVLLPAENDNDKYHDSHYRKLVVQPIEVMQMIMTPEEIIGFLKGQIIKYSMRAGLKEGENVQKEIDKVARYKEWLDLARQGKPIIVK